MDLSNKSKQEVIPWIEKYRPSKIDDIISQSNIVDILKTSISNNNLQHLLFHGPPGTGKTSTIMACAQLLYGDKLDLMILNINASEERGIEVVRNRIQQFINAKIIHNIENKCAFKLVILDEADAMTPDAQAMLRKVIEKYSYCARFCLICNYIKKITPALHSRCACYRFAPLSFDNIKIRMLEIVKKENIIISDNAINTIIERSHGDMRKVLNILQTCHMAYSNITDEQVNSFVEYPLKHEMDAVIYSLFNDDFEVSYNKINDIIQNKSYTMQFIINFVSEILVNICINKDIHIYEIDSNKYNYISLLKIISKLGTIEYNLSSSINENIHFTAFIGLFKN